jgi:hypothetical protein
MSLIAKMFVEDKEINILDFKFRFTRAVNEHGFPMGKPNGTVFEIIYETTSDQSFMSWAIATDMRKDVKIVVSPVSGASKSRIIELYDVYCVHFKNNFNAQNGEPMTTLIHLTPAIMIDDGYKVLDHYWKTKDLSTNNVTPTVIKQEEEMEIIDMYYEDKEGNKLQSLFYGDVALVIQTKNGAGKKITLNLNDKNHDFIHDGKELENDLLENISITSDITRIKVKVIPPRS